MLGVLVNRDVNNKQLERRSLKKKKKKKKKI